METLAAFQAQWYSKIQSELETQIKLDVQQPLLQAAMSYAVLAGGKRLRPLLTLAVVQTFGLNPADYLKASSAIELIHSYSLIHDDLPAMDDDVLRRGQPTTHVKFGEDVAILAGDALQPLAFQWLVTDEHLKDVQKVQMAQMLGHAAGPNGMVGGQILDMQYTGNQTVSLADATQVHALKTGAIIRYAVKAGGVIADADAKTLAALDRFGAAYGLAFQIKDDLDDLEQDGSEDKQAYPTILTIPGAVKALQEQVDAAQTALDEIQQHCQVDTSLLASFLGYYATTLEKKWQ